MSDFLVNVVRRGAALPFGMSIQPPTMPDFSPVIGEMEAGAVDQPPSSFAAESRRTELGRDASMRRVSGTALQDTTFPTPQPGMIASSSSSEAPTPQTPLPSIQLESHVSEATATAPVGVRTKVAETSQDSQPPTDRVPGVTLPSAEELPGPRSSERVSVSLAPREKGAHGGEHRGETQILNPVAQGGSPQPSPPRQEPRPPQAAIELIDVRIPSEEADAQVALAAREAREGGGQIAPRPERIWEAGEALGFWREGDEAPSPTPEAPRVEVRIGRVEIRVTTPPLPVAPASRQKPSGFVEYTRARSYRDRKWY
jgi:hypothetical protein